MEQAYKSTLDAQEILFFEDSPKLNGQILSSYFRTYVKFHVFVKKERNSFFKYYQQRSEYLVVNVALHFIEIQDVVLQHLLHQNSNLFSDSISLYVYVLIYMSYFQDLRYVEITADVSIISILFFTFFQQTCRGSNIFFVQPMHAVRIILMYHNVLNKKHNFSISLLYYTSVIALNSFNV